MSNNHITNEKISTNDLVGFFDLLARLDHADRLAIDMSTSKDTEGVLLPVANKNKDTNVSRKKHKLKKKSYKL